MFTITQTIVRFFAESQYKKSHPKKLGRLLKSKLTVNYGQSKNEIPIRSSYCIVISLLEIFATSFLGKASVKIPFSYLASIAAASIFSSSVNERLNAF